MSNKPTTVKTPAVYTPIYTIDKLPEAQRKVISGAVMRNRDTMGKICRDHGVSAEAIYDYMLREIKPAIVASLQNDPLTARYCLNYLWNETVDSIDAVKRGKIVEADGKDVMVREDYRRFGTVATLIGTGQIIARTIGELNGEIGGQQAEKDEGPRPINAILVPKSRPAPVIIEQQPALDVGVSE